MIKRISTGLLLLMLAATMASGQAFDAMRRTTTFTNTDLMLTQTNSAGSAGQKFTAAVTWSNVLETLKSFSNWPTSTGGSGESNFLAAASTTNGTRFELPYDKTGTTNRVKTLEMGYGMAATNQSTNLVVAVDAAAIPNHTQLNTASNGLIALHAMAFTNANQVWSNVVVVNPTANVLTNGILLTNAVKYAGTLASASRPVLVRIMPGTYGTPTNTLPSVMWAADNVSTYWDPGAVWWSGTAGGAVAWMFDDQTAARTNCHVYGRGRFFITNDSINVFYVEKESRVRFECLSMYVTDGVGGNSTASPFTWGGVTNDMDVTVHDYMESEDYDAFYGALAAGQRLRLKAKTVRAIGDIFEFSDDSPQWGNVILDIDRAEQTATTGQASFLQMAGRVHARIGQIKVASTVSAMAANGSTNGILQGAIIELPANGTRSVIQDNSGGSWHTGLWLRDCVLIGPTNVDALTLTNIATVPTILENTTIRPGWASTNWARGATPSNVKIVGGFNLDPYKPLGSQVTVISTNYLPAIRNIGTLVQHGASYFSNSVSITGGNLAVNGYDLYSLGAYFDSFIATNILNMPNGAGPYTPGDGDIAFDNNYWAAGRGAIVTWDGTANVVIPLALQSDTPSNGQVLKFNTGGTFTWEDDNNSGGGSTNNIVTATGTAIVTNGIIPAVIRAAMLRGTNLWIDGATEGVGGGYYQQAIATTAGGLTNLMVTNIVDGQTILLRTWVTNGATAQLPQFTAAQYEEGRIIGIPTNGWTAIYITRSGTETNVSVRGPTMTGVPGYGTTWATNFAGNTVTQGVSTVLQGLHANTASTVTNENSTALQIDSGVLSLSPGALSNFVASTINVTPNNVISNLGAIKGLIWTNYVQTVSNFVFSFNTNYVELKNQTNAVFTNIVEEATGVRGNIEIHIHNTTGVTMGLVWPAYGAQHGYFFGTNINNPIITTTSLTTGKHGIASIACFGTNLFATWTEWP